MKTSGRVKAYLQDQIKAEGILTRGLLFLFFDRIIARIPTMTPCRKQTDEIKRKLPRARVCQRQVMDLSHLTKVMLMYPKI